MSKLLVFRVVIAGIGFVMMLNDPQNEADLSFLWINFVGLLLMMLSGLTLRKK